MNFALLWLAALVVALLWVATDVACVGRLKRRWARALLSMIILLVPLAVLGMFVVATATAKFNFKIENNWFAYAASLFLTFLAGTAFILWQGERHEPGSPPNAAHWRRAPLAIAGVIAATVWYMTLLNMDFAVRARCALLSVEVNSVYLATLPAITRDAQNAAPLYEKAFAQLKNDSELERQVNNTPTGNSNDFDPNEPATITFLKHEAGTVTLLRRAAALPACRFDQDLGDPEINGLLPNLNAERNAANVLNLDAREQTARGHAAVAVADAAAIIEMSRHFGCRPLLISGLVAMGIDELGNKTLEVALPAVKRADELDALRLDDLPPMGRVFQQTLRSEERFGLLLYGNMPTNNVHTAKDHTIEAGDTRLLASGVRLSDAYIRVFFLDSDEYVNFMESLESMATQPYYTVSDQLKDRPAGLFTAILIPSMTRAFQTAAEIGTGDDCARTAVAMTRFRLDHGTLPSHLNELVPKYLDEVPTDPFDGKPLRLAIRNNQWIIYSVGPDRVDDGGVEIDRGKGDVIFTLTLAPMEATTKP